MQIEKLLLRNVRLDELSKAFKRSLMLKNSEALNFLISTGTISNVSCNSTEAFFKKWELVTSDIAEYDKDFNPIKVSIYKGEAFVQNVLSYFGSSCNIEIEHIKGEAHKLTIFNDELKIIIATAPVKLAYTEYDSESIAMTFSKSDSIYKFDLTYEELKRIGSLSKLSTNPDTQKRFVEFYTKDGFLYATDNAFDIRLHEIEAEFDNVCLNKSFIGFFCHEDYTMYVSSMSGSKVMVAESMQSNTVSSVVLVEKVDVVEEEFDLSSADFNWDDSSDESLPF